MITELLTGKLKLKKLYDEYLSENRPPQLFWDDAVTKLDLKLITNFKKNSYIPSKGKLIVIANHAFGVADGVSICSVLSKVRQDYKMVTHKVLRQADAVKDKILPIDFNETKEALLTNINTRKEAEKVLLNDGVIVLFPSGRIATKKNLNKNTKADDGEWKQWVSKLILKTKSPVLPIFFDGQNSQWYHMANKLGLTFRYSLCMYELKRKIGDSINMYFGSIISYEDLAEIGDIKEITLHLRSVTYSLDPQLNNN
tara:strand:- start:657 stop:1421 length:765 start_codon:yes stop_codon:yes gene_type:complete